MELDALPAEVLEDVAEVVGRLKHDLGKYVAFQARWLGADATPLARREALEADLLATRRGPDGTVDAATVWSEFRDVLLGVAALPRGATVALGDHPDVAAISDAMAVISDVIGVLRDGSATPADIDRGTEAAQAVAQGCRELQRAVRSAGS